MEIYTANHFNENQYKNNYKDLIKYTYNMISIISKLDISGFNTESLNKIYKFKDNNVDKAINKDNKSISMILILCYKYEQE